MANPLRGEAALEVDGQQLTLVIDINALCEAEEALGLDVDLMLAKYAAGTSVRMVRALVWAGLQARHPCTLDEAGGIVSRAGFLPAKAALEKALKAAMPAPEDDRTQNPRKGGRKVAGSGTG